MQQENRIITFIKLKSFLDSKEGKETIENWKYLISNENRWFTGDNVDLMLTTISNEYLEEKKLRDFLSKYTYTNEPKKIGLVSAGNIPAVGFFDMMVSLLAGHHVLIKLSNSDSVLTKKLIEKLIEINPDFKNYIFIVDRLNDADAFVATGSDNSARYFEYYFSKKPNIIRKNRSSVAVLTGNETRTQLANLADDIFMYFGLGCRNVSKVFVPKGYDFTIFFESIVYWNTITLNHKYNNNYDYNKALLLVNGTTHLDNGFLLVTQSLNLVSPISVLFFEEYDNFEHLESSLYENKDKIQCLVGEGLAFKTLNFGQSQNPTLEDFPDGIDIMKFLNEI